MRGLLIEMARLYPGVRIYNSHRTPGTITALFLAKQINNIACYIELNHLDLPQTCVLHSAKQTHSILHEAVILMQFLHTRVYLATRFYRRQCYGFPIVVSKYGKEIIIEHNNSCEASYRLNCYRKTRDTGIYTMSNQLIFAKSTLMRFRIVSEFSWENIFSKSVFHTLCGAVCFIFIHELDFELSYRSCCLIRSLMTFLSGCVQPP